MRFLENASRFSQRGGGTEQTLLPKERRRRRRRRVLLAKEEGFSWCTVDSSVLPKIAPKFPLFFFVFFQNGNTLVVVTFFSPLSSSVSPSTKAADEIRFKRTHTHNNNNTNNNQRHAVRDDCFSFPRFHFRVYRSLCLSVSLSLRARACGFRFGQPPLAFHMRTSKTRADGMHRALFFSLTRAPHNAVKLSTSKPASAVTRLAPSFGRYAIRRGDNCLFLFLDIFFLLLYWSTVRGVNTALLASNAH